MYKVPVEKYNKLLKENVTKEYKITSKTEIKTINKEAKKIAKSYKLEDRIESMAEKEAFITLKDHKENFVNNPKCRLINPSKSEIGIISSKLLKEFNDRLRNILKINH